MVYEVFARKSRGEPLRHVGALNAPDDELARVYAFNTYDEERWFDMWVVPRDRLVEVFNAEREAGGELGFETPAVPAPGNGAVGAFGNVANEES